MPDFRAKVARMDSVLFARLSDAATVNGGNPGLIRVWDPCARAWSNPRWCCATVTCGTRTASRRATPCASAAKHFQSLAWNRTARALRHWFCGKHPHDGSAH